MCFQLPKKVIGIRGHKAKLADGSWVDLSLMTEECVVGDHLFVADKFAVSKISNQTIINQ